jgi:solute:Na+ symporter, SSS family
MAHGAACHGCIALLALLAYMGASVGVEPTSDSDMVPALFKTLFPRWFARFAFVAMVIGALLSAALMAIGAANPFIRYFWNVCINPAVTPTGEAQVTKITSMLVRVGR